MKYLKRFNESNNTPFRSELLYTESSDDYKDHLLKWYMKGFNDERRGTSTVESDNRIDMVAYHLGAQHAIISDDVSSIDKLSNEEIIDVIEDMYNKN